MLASARDHSTLEARCPFLITGFLNLVEAIKHYQCAKSAWIEFLGEANIPATRRVQQ